jgi:hypothetical protein
MTREELLASGLAKLASKDKSQRHYALSDFEMILNQNPNDTQVRFYMFLTKALLGFEETGLKEFLKSDISLYYGLDDKFGRKHFYSLHSLIANNHLTTTYGWDGKQNNITPMIIKDFNVGGLIEFFTNELPKIWLKALKYDELVKEIKQLEIEGDGSSTP